MKPIKLLALIATGMFAISSSLLANTIILSGDSNIQPSWGFDNPVFFDNVLGGGTSVIVHRGTGGTSPGHAATVAANIDGYYNGLGGVSSTSLTTVPSLSGVDLFVSVLPTTAWSPADIAELSSFLSGGGTAFFIGENGNFPTANGEINSALSSLGSTMSIIPNSTFDSGGQNATGAQIVADPLTAGVTNFFYAAPSEALVAGGTTLLMGTGDQPFIAVERFSVSVPDGGSTLLLLGLSLGVVGRVAKARRKG